MKYTQIQRRDYGEFVTIGEYIKERQPNILQKLYRGFRLKDVTELILAAADVSCRDKQYASVMTERPKSGRGGLLPGEKEEDL